MNPLEMAFGDYPIRPTGRLAVLLVDYEQRSRDTTRYALALRGSELLGAGEAWEVVADWTLHATTDLVSDIRRLVDAGVVDPIDFGRMLSYLQYRVAAVVGTGRAAGGDL